jgi:predicted CXXCH cytochrome family protein
MNPRMNHLLMRALIAAVILATMPALLGGTSAWAAVQFLGDGARQNSQGGWDLPTQGSCPADTTKLTRPDCLALRLNFTSVTCPLTNVRAFTTSGVCNDLINNTQLLCEAQPDRLWNAGTGICAIVMHGDDRNNVVCAQHGGTFDLTGTCTGVWVLPDSSTYVPPLFTGSTNPGPGDQCLRCHNSVTEYNGPRIRDVDWFLRTGHKNMSRKVTPGMPWAGPGYACSNPLFTDMITCVANGGTWDRSLVIYPSDDSANPFDWINGRVGICTNSLYKNSTDCTNNGGTWNNFDMPWIYGDWLSPLPREIIRAPASSSQVCTDPRGTAATCASFGGTMVNNAGASYSCARCHTTGWTSDAVVGPSTGNLAKEPEKSFPGITWDRLSNAGPGVVNLSGGVLNDSHPVASWDYWGIACSRCHSSAVENTSNGGVPPYSSPTGMSSHHSVMTSPDVASGAGYCTDSRFTAQPQCDAAGAAWLTACSLAGTCSLASFTTSGTCLAGTGTWTRYDTQALCLTNGGTWTAPGCVGDATLTTQATCQGAGKTWFGPGCTNATLTTQTTCEAANAVWSDSRCDVAGICGNGLFTDAATCKANGFYWGATTDVIRCDDAGGRWAGSKPNRGQIITRLCMDCHRQETSGVPYANTSATAGTYDTVNPGMYLKVGPVHGTFDFVSHPHGPMFLNSPHGLFTGTFNEIATGNFAFDMTGKYKSFFQLDGEAANTGNGCTGCHDVHKSTVEEAFEPAPGQEGAIKEVCTSCHSGQFNKDLTKINHLAGPGTPLEEMADGENWEACVSCHMPEGLHLFRINPDPTYSTFPQAAITATSSAQCTTAGGTWSASSASCTVNANMAAEGSFSNAVWVDLDYACGQCHGGGTAQAVTTGNTVGGTKTVTVASSTGFVPGQRVRITDGGALAYDDEGLNAGDFDSYIVSVPDATHINLIGAPPFSVSGKAVVQNPTKNGAPYYTKAQLAPVAEGMHASAGVTYSVSYTTSLVPNSLTVNVNATVDCGGTCPPFTYDWDWGDGTAHGTVNPGSHAYATAGSKTILLTVRLASNGLSVGSYGRTISFASPDLPPTVDGTCTWLGDTWTMNVLDSSSDDGPDADILPGDGNATLRIVVDWGDGTSKTITTQGALMSHAYIKTGTFTVTQKAIDSKLQVATRTCPVQATPAYFRISGKVTDSGGTINLVGATVQIKKGTNVVKTMYTAADGSFDTGSTLKPAIYDVVVSKSGYTFALPAATLQVGGDKLGNTIKASGPVVASPAVTKTLMIKE